MPVERPPHRPKRHRMRPFVTALVLTLCVLGVGAACLVTEYNMQKTAYGRVDFGIGYTLEDGVPRPFRTNSGEMIGIGVTEKAAAFVPPPLRLCAVLRRAVGQWLWETARPVLSGWRG